MNNVMYNVFNQLLFSVIQKILKLKKLLIIN
jgi:hypothetical protein